MDGEIEKECSIITFTQETDMDEPGSPILCDQETDISENINETFSTQILENVKVNVEEVKECIEHMSKCHIRRNDFAIFYNKNVSELEGETLRRNSKGKQSKPVSANKTSESGNRIRWNRVLVSESFQRNNYNEKQTNFDLINIIKLSQKMESIKLCLQTRGTNIFEKNWNGKQAYSVSDKETLEHYNGKQSNLILYNETLGRSTSHEKQSDQVSDDITLEPSNGEQSNSSLANDTLQLNNCNGKQPNSVLASATLQHRNGKLSNPVLVNETLILNNYNGKQFNPVSSNKPLEHNGKKTNLVSVNKTLRHSNRERANPITVKISERSNGKKTNLVSVNKTLRHSNREQANPISVKISERSNGKLSNLVSSNKTMERINGKQSNKVLANETLQNNSCDGKDSNLDLADIMELLKKMENIKRFIESSITKNYKNNCNGKQSYLDLPNINELSQKRESNKLSQELYAGTNYERSCIRKPSNLVSDKKSLEINNGKQSNLVFANKILPLKNCNKKQSNRNLAHVIEMSQKMESIKRGLESCVANTYNGGHHMREYQEEQKIPVDYNLNLPTYYNMNDKNYNPPSPELVNPYIITDIRKVIENKRKKVTEEVYFDSEDYSGHDKHMQDITPIKPHNRFVVQFLTNDNCKNNNDNDSGHEDECRKRQKMSGDYDFNVTLKNGGHHYTMNAKSKNYDPVPSISIKSYTSDRRKDTKSRRLVVAGEKSLENEIVKRGKKCIQESPRKSCLKYLPNYENNKCRKKKEMGHIQESPRKSCLKYLSNYENNSDDGYSSHKRECWKRKEMSEREHRKLEETPERDYRKRGEILDREYRKLKETREREYRKRGEISYREHRKLEETPERDYRKRGEILGKEYRKLKETPEREYRKRGEISDREYQKRGEISFREHRKREQTPAYRNRMEISELGCRKRQKMSDDYNLKLPLKNVDHRYRSSHYVPSVSLESFIDPREEFDMKRNEMIKTRRLSKRRETFLKNETVGSGEKQTKESESQAIDEIIEMIVESNKSKKKYNKISKSSKVNKNNKF